MLLTLVGSIFADNLTVSSVELKAGESKDVAINLNNSEKQYAAFQFDIVLPEGISIAKNDKGKLKVSLNADRIDDHTLTVQDLGSGTYRLVCFSISNAEFSDTSGALVNYLGIYLLDRNRRFERQPVEQCPYRLKESSLPTLRFIQLAPA